MMIQPKALLALYTGPLESFRISCVNVNVNVNARFVLFFSLSFEDRPIFSFENDRKRPLFFPTEGIFDPILSFWFIEVSVTNYRSIDCWYFCDVIAPRVSFWLHLCYNIMNRTMKLYNLYNYEFVVQSKLSRVSTKQRK